MVATARLAAFNIKEISDLTNTDDMELERIGMPINDNSPILQKINADTGKHIGNGKVAYFIITKPILLSISWQVFSTHRYLL